MTQEQLEAKKFSPFGINQKRQKVDFQNRSYNGQIRAYVTAIGKDPLAQPLQVPVENRRVREDPEERR